MKHRHPATTGHADTSAGGMEITARAPPTPPGALLGQAVPRHLVLGDHLRGYGGIHGGLALALMPSAMQGQAAGEPLGSVTARYHRPITGEFRIEATPIRSGQAARTLAARATGQNGPCADATGVFGSHSTPGGPGVWARA